MGRKGHFVVLHFVHLGLFFLLLFVLFADAKPKRTVRSSAAKDIPVIRKDSPSVGAGCPVSRHRKIRDVLDAISQLLSRRQYGTAIACIDLALNIRDGQSSLKENDQLILDHVRMVLGNYIEFCGCPSNGEVPRVSPRPSAIEMTKACLLSAKEYDNLYWILGRQYEAVGDADSMISVGQGIECVPIARTLRYVADKIASKHPTKAFEFAKQVVAMEPNNPINYAILGTSYFHTGDTKEAVSALERSITMDRHLFEGLHRLGSLYSIMGDASRAIHFLKLAIEEKRDSSLAWDNMGVVYFNLNKMQKAATSFESAVKHDSRNFVALMHLARTYELQDRLVDSLRILDKALRIDSGWTKGIVSRERIRQNLAMGWVTWGENGEVLRRIVKKELEGSPSGETSVGPFDCLIFPLSSVLCRRIARRAAMQAINSVCSEAQSMNVPCEGYFDYTKAVPSYGHSKIRVGYISPDFRNHPVAKCLYPLFGLHDRELVSVHTYSIAVSDGSEWREHVKNGSDVFVEESGTEIAPNAVMARRIKHDEIDILVNLGGYTAHSRPTLHALRPAPVHINFFGYLGTMGHPRLADYIVTDRTTTPAHLVSGRSRIAASTGSLPDQHDPSIFAERTIFMPKTFFFSSHIISHPCERNSSDFHCFCPDKSQLGPFIEARNKLRVRYGLPRDSLVFSALGGPYKITPNVLQAWMDILNQVTGSVLLLSKGLGDNELKRSAEKYGLGDLSRLIFMENIPFNEHIQVKSLADIALDTPLYNGHSSSIDMIYAAVPLVTLPGSRDKIVSRAAASLLHSVDLDELIAKNFDDYIRIAVDLANSLNRRIELRSKLCSARHTSPLFQMENWTAQWEKGLAIVHELRSAGRLPWAIIVN